MVKIINSPVMFQMHSTAVQLKSSERDRERGGDSMTDKYLSICLYGKAYCDYVFCLTSPPPCLALVYRCCMWVCESISDLLKFSVEANVY